MDKMSMGGLSSFLYKPAGRWVLMLGSIWIWVQITVPAVLPVTQFVAPELIPPLIYVFAVVFIFVFGTAYEGMLLYGRPHWHIWLRLIGFLLLTRILLSGEVVLGTIIVGLIAFFTWDHHRKVRPEGRVVQGQEIQATAYRVEAAMDKLRAVNNDPGFLFGGVRPPSDYFKLNTLIVGSTGSGKSVTLKLIAQQVLNGIGINNKRALIYDPAGEWPSTLEALNIRDDNIIFTNPLDQRCSPWDISKDIKSPTEARTLAELLVPIPHDTKDPYWLKATQLCIIAIVRFLNKKAAGRWTLRDLLLMVNDKDIILAICSTDRKLYKYSLVWGSPNTSQSILATILTELEPYETVAALWHAAETVYINKPFSVSEWVKSNKVLILGRSTTAKTALERVNRVIFTRAVDLIMEEPEQKRPNTWMFLDELGSLGKIDALLTAATELRKRGVALVGCCQSFNQLVVNFSKEKAEIIAGQFNNIAGLRLSLDSTSERWLREIAGKAISEEWSESYTRRFGEPSSSTHTQHFVERDVLQAGTLNGIPIFEPERGVGLKGYYRSGHYMWWHTYKSDIVNQLPPKGDVSQNLIRIPGKYEELEPWSEADWERLNISDVMAQVIDSLGEDQSWRIISLDDSQVKLPSAVVVASQEENAIDRLKRARRESSEDQKNLSTDSLSDARSDKSKLEIVIEKMKQMEADYYELLSKKEELLQEHEDSEGNNSG